MRETNGQIPDINLARIVNFDSFRVYRWLVTIAEPNPKLYGFLRDNGVGLNHVLNLLGDAIHNLMVMQRSLVVR